MIVDLLGLEAAQVAVLDQVVRMAVMLLVADVVADVVQEARILEPLALAVAEAVNPLGLVEQRQRERRDLPRVLGFPGAALRQLDHRTAAHVRIAIDARDVACGGGGCSRAGRLRAAPGRRA